MFKVSGLPVQITKSDLEELFSPYGKIQITETSIVIKIEKDESIAFVALDKEENEKAAINKLDKTQWRNKYILYLDPIRGDDIKIGQPQSKDSRMSDGDGSKVGQPQSNDSATEAGDDRKVGQPQS
ncbi:MULTISPECIES: RNA recognition motif domain-containing protein [unclassified Tolypothrix]|uniref:RNA recognition motif domain-containing protein n=1 Tax=unclassified Tolypothrix TaxID=2649714 RepID=UPI0005EAAD3C|nr:MULTISPECIES: RNA-binding protein [unclassified Tolypothrix]BAY94456.1 RNA binding protein [Microchaete diplosiphon NIES-3275]EKF02832.1 RNA-binding protein [Tolypothrix sp. PCC 7601]MBE9087241.1 RNA-binding protein [Tolypothrix sp. LEGE 11397]UYD28167.1 RNA-binding protein [Tolypothrix sp. PCC 7712]UYD35956.1 RNA-binding protein [Tolypothrix sp. PCC 7601]